MSEVFAHTDERLWSVSILTPPVTEALHRCKQFDSPIATPSCLGTEPVFDRFAIETTTTAVVDDEVRGGFPAGRSTLTERTPASRLSLLSLLVGRLYEEVQR